MKKIVLTGGGSAGHVMPNLAIIKDLKKHYDKIYYIGSDGIEKDIIKNQTSLMYYQIPAVKLVRSFNPKNILIPFKLINSIIKARGVLKRLKPNIVFSKGGYVSVPVAIAAKSLGIPIVSHESDYSLGLANKIIYKTCKVMCCSFSDTAKELKKGYYSGSPIREELKNGSKQKIVKEYGLSKTKPTILIIGGSLGSENINKIITKNIAKLTAKYNVLHLTGKNKVNENIKQKNYYQIDYVSNIEDFYAAADIVIGRAGSNVIFELLYLNKPMLLIPLGTAESRGDQILNAQYFKKQGYAKVILEENLKPLLLLKTLEDLYKNKKTYTKKMSECNFKNGNNNIVNKIVKHTKQKRP